MMILRNRSIGLAALALALSALAVAARAEEPIKIGLVLPYSSVFAAIGDTITKGMELGFEKFGNEVAGRKIELIKEDTEVKPNVGLQKARKLVLQNKVDMLVGPVSSAVAGAMRDFVHAAKVPLIINNAGNNDLTGPRCSRWVIRTSFSNSQIARVMGPWLAGKGVNSVYLIAFDYAAGHQMMDAFRATFEASGGKIVGESYPPLRETKDFGPYLALVKSAAPDAVFVFFGGGPAIKFVKEFDAFGLKGKVKLTGTGWTTSALYIHAQGDSAEGFIGSLNYVPSIDRPENKEFQAAFQAKFGRIGDEFAVQGYDTAHLIVEALKLTKGKTDDKGALVDAFHKVSIVGPRGPLRIDPLTNNVIQDIYIFENQKIGDKVRQIVVDKVANVQDKPNGCQM